MTDSSGGSALRRHLSRDLEALTRQILEVGVMVEQATHAAMRALAERDEALAHEVISGDKLVDRREIEVEEECLKILALHQPVAGDLRRVVAMLKVNNDLERAGDLARNIAERTLEILAHGADEAPAELEELATKSRSMLRECLQAVTRQDPVLARQVLDADDEVDRLHEEMYRIISRRIADAPGQAGEAMRYLSISRYLERIADLATNVAEDVIFVVEGEVVRHADKLSVS